MTILLTILLLILLTSRAFWGFLILLGTILVAIACAAAGALVLFTMAQHLMSLFGG